MPIVLEDADPSPGTVIDAAFTKRIRMIMMKKHCRDGDSLFGRQSALTWHQGGWGCFMSHAQ